MHQTLSMKELTSIQKELVAKKSLRNSFGNYNYRNAEQIYECVKPLLEKHSCTLVITDSIEYVGTRYYIKATATITNADGQSVSASSYARESEAKKGMDEAQITGSCSSYARKYALSGLLLIDDGDNDPDARDNRDTGSTASPAPKRAAKKANTPVPDVVDLNTVIKDLGKITTIEGLKEYAELVRKNLTPEQWEQFKPYGAQRQKEIVAGA